MIKKSYGSNPETRLSSAVDRGTGAALKGLAAGGAAASAATRAANGTGSHQLGDALAWRQSGSSRRASGERAADCRVADCRVADCTRRPARLLRLSGGLAPAGPGEGPAAKPYGRHRTSARFVCASAGGGSPMKASSTKASSSPSGGSRWEIMYGSSSSMLLHGSGRGWRGISRHGLV